MTFPRKGTRRITVAGQRFVWHVSPKALDYGGVQCTVQSAAGAGRLLCFWPETGFPSPRETSENIESALAQGWDPASTGSPLWIVRGTRGGRYLREQRVPPAWLVDETPKT